MLGHGKFSFINSIFWVAFNGVYPFDSMNKRNTSMLQTRVINFCGKQGSVYLTTKVQTISLIINVKNQVEKKQPKYRNCINFDEDEYYP